MKLLQILKAGCKYLSSSDYRFLINANLGFYNQMSDENYLKRMFKACTGRQLDLDDPQTFNEKLQWLKLYDRNPEYTKMVDKYDAKRYVADKIGEEYVVPTFGVWDRPEDIDFEILPERFVLKCTHDCGGLVICRDKTKFDEVVAKGKLFRHMKRNYFMHGREWPYKNVRPRIFAEQLLSDEHQKDSLIDYKFYCFNGQPKFLYVSEGLHDHDTARISFLNLDWSFAPFQRSDYKEFEELPPKPVNYEMMLEFATILSENTPFLRVDLYEVEGKVYFSELTFFPASGYSELYPSYWNKNIGDWIKLPPRMVEMSQKFKFGKISG